MYKPAARPGKRRRRCPKRCNVGIYHTGAFVLFVGILVAIAGMATCHLFQVYLYDHRKPAEFLHVDIPVGLFSVFGKVTRLSMNQQWLPHELNFSDSRWTWAKVTCVLGVLASCVALIQHLVMACIRIEHKWSMVVFELLAIFFSVVSVLIGLSLAECQIEYIHDDGDPDLSQFLNVNGLLQSTSKQANSNQANQNSSIKTLERGDFALFVTPPQSSFHLLVAAEFLFVLAFLAVLIRFVCLCEKEMKARRQMQQGETS